MTDAIKHVGTFGSLTTHKRERKSHKGFGRNLKLLGHSSELSNTPTKSWTKEVLGKMWLGSAYVLARVRIAAPQTDSSNVL